MGSKRAERTGRKGDREVAQLLKRHLAELTKSGNLDGAIALRSVIRDLESGNIPDLTKTESEPTNENDDGIQVSNDAIVGTRWKGRRGPKDDQELHFLDEGKMTVTDTDGKVWTAWVWRITEGGELQIQNSNQPFSTVEFSKSGEEFSYSFQVGVEATRYRKSKKNKQGSDR